MDGPAGKKEKAKDILNHARLKAQQGDQDKAFELFEACVREYLRNRMQWKALAAARTAKTSFKNHPRAQAMVIRILTSMGLEGEVRKELSERSTAWLKNEAPLFRDLNLDEFTGVLEIMQVERLGKGRSIVKQGEKNTDVFMVRKGTLEVFRDGALLSVLLAGDVFGELEFFFQEAPARRVCAPSRRARSTGCPQRPSGRSWRNPRT
jgi:hypothetical protein